MHFESNKTEILAMMYSGVATTNQPEWWSEEANTMYHSDHTASLPASADSAGQLTASPFYARSQREWRTSPGLWRCDDLADGRDAGHTIHRMWVKFSDTAPIQKTDPNAAIAVDGEQLIAQWPLDSGWGNWARDSAGNGNRAEVFSDETSGNVWLQGSSGLNSTAGGWASVPPSATLSAISSGGTLSAWILFGDKAGQDTIVDGGTILSQQKDGGEGIAVSAHGNAITVMIHGEGGLITLNAPNVVNRQQPEWTFIAVTFDNDLSKLFVNESQVDSKGGNQLRADVVQQTPLLIGAGLRDGAQCCSFTGAIKNVQIFRNALSNDEISALSVPVADSSSVEVSPLEEDSTQGKPE